MNQVVSFKLSHGINTFILILVIILLIAKPASSQNGDSGDDEHDKSQPKSLNPGMSVVLVFFISVFFLTAIISLYIRQCGNGGGPTGFFRRTPPSPNVQRIRGLDPMVVNTFPTFLYSEVKGHRICQRALECAVCLLEFEDNEILRLLPKCSHVFHLICIDPWLALHVTCPVCRANLVPKPDELMTTSCSCNFDLPPGTSALNYSPRDNGASAGSSIDLIIEISGSTTPDQLITTPRQNLYPPPRSTPRRSEHHNMKFQRSHSTGHLIIRPGENCDRFMLRLPADVRSQLMARKSPSISSPINTGVFQSLRSERKGYRSNSLGSSRGKNYERFDSAGRSSGWNFKMTPPFLSQTSLVIRSPGNDLTAATPRNLMRSMKSPLDRLLRVTDKDDDGQRSTRRLIPDDQA